MQNYVERITTAQGSNAGRLAPITGNLREDPRAPLEPIRTTDRNEPEIRSACPNPIEVYAGIDHPGVAGDGVKYVPVELPCRRLTCPKCGPKLKAALSRHYAEQFGALDDVMMATLTLDPKLGVDAEESRRYIVHVWSKWRKRVNRLSEGGLRYMATIERQGNGMAHLHAVISAPGTQPLTLADAWFSAGGGVVANVEYIRDDRDQLACIGYCLKYALKEANAHHRSGRRYVLASQGLGYYAAEHRERRRQAFEDQTATVDYYTIPHEPTGHSIERPQSPDVATPEDLERWKRLDFSARTTKYRWRDPRTNTWWQITQTPNGRTMERLSSSYRSPIEKALGRQLE